MTSYRSVKGRVDDDGSYVREWGLGSGCGADAADGRGETERMRKINGRI